MSLESVLEEAWRLHGEQPERVADVLTASMPLVNQAAQLAPMAAIVSHVFGEHLGQWARGIALLDVLPALDPEANPTIARHRAVLGFMAGDRVALDALSGDERVAALAQVATMATGRADLDAAVDAYQQALAAATDGVADASPAPRALAVAGNNLAAALEAHPGRSAAQDRAMVRAAEAGLTWWRRAGGWLEEERAAYRLARSQLQAGLAAQALVSARLCQSVCAAHEAPPFEQFFAHAVAAMACHACGDRQAFATERRRAEVTLDQVPAEDRAWCEDDWRAIANAYPDKDGAP